MPRSKGIWQGLSDYVTKSAANRNGKVKYGQGLGPHVFDKKITDDGRGDGGITGLTDANDGSHGHERIVIFHERSCQGCYGPNCNADNHDIIPVEPIAQVSKQGGKDHETGNKGCLQKSRLAIVDLVWFLNLV